MLVDFQNNTERRFISQDGKTYFGSGEFFGDFTIKVVGVIKAPFTLQKILGTAQIKVVRVAKKIVLVSNLHVLSSTVLDDVKLCFGTGKRLNISASILDSCLVRVLLTRRTKSS